MRTTTRSCYADPTGLYASEDEQMCGHYGCVGPTDAPVTVSAGYYGYGPTHFGGGTGSPGGPGGTVTSPSRPTPYAPPLASDGGSPGCRTVNCEISGQPDVAVHAPQDDDYVTYDGNQCLVGSACWVDWVDYQLTHDPAVDRAITAFLVGDDYHGCVDGNSGFFGGAWSCVLLATTIFPGGGELSDAGKGTKVIKWITKGEKYTDKAAKLPKTIHGVERLLGTRIRRARNNDDPL